jgi:hypothetical protein
VSVPRHVSRSTTVCAAITRRRSTGGTGQRDGPPPTIASTRRHSTSHCAAPITPPATAPAIKAAPTDSTGPSSGVATTPPIGKPRNAAPQAGQIHRPPLGLGLLRVMWCLSALCECDELTTACADKPDESSHSRCHHRLVSDGCLGPRLERRVHRVETSQCVVIQVPRK